MQIAAPVAAAPSAHIKDTTTQNFAIDVIEASKHQPVIVDFWAPWCGPCRQLAPVIEKAVNAAAGKVKLVKLNIDEHPAIPGQLGVQSIPTVIAFHKGQPIDAFAGALPESQIKQFIDGLGGGAAAPDMASVLKAADAALAADDLSGAFQAYDMVYSQEPDNLRALAGMAHTHLRAGRTVQARALLDTLPDNKKSDPQLASIMSALVLSEKSNAVSDLDTMRAKLQRDPLDHAARYDLALALAGQGKKDEAVEALLYILHSKRDWNEGAAKSQLLQFFEAWGFDDDAAIEGRKKLSSLLFA